MAVMRSVSIGRYRFGHKVLFRGLAVVCAGAALLCGSSLEVAGAETMPPAPKQYFNDYAGVVSRQTAQDLNVRLTEFEREHSSQILVVVFPKMLSDSSIEDYTFRVAESWKVGRKGLDNGAVLFVFIEDRKMFLQVGYGLEGALPDALAKQIIDNEIKPHFKEGNYQAGLAAGIDAMLAAVQGEYQGLGRTVAEQGAKRGKTGSLFQKFLLLMVILFFVAPLFRAMIPGYRRRRYSRHWGGGWTVGGGDSWGSGGGGWGGGGGFSGGGFSGGGGRFGGGGAGGSW